LLALSAEEWGIVMLSLQVSLAAILGVLPVAFALAWVLARARFPGKILLDALVHLPLVLPPVVVGWLMLIAFAPEGPAGRVLAMFGVSVLFRWTGAALAADVSASAMMNAQPAALSRMRARPVSRPAGRMTVW
jgi:molybdate transport system permease protein